jgi:predicted membrane-bound dolichyl-phosphate-mannose-protein mannosyltransferase
MDIMNVFLKLAQGAGPKWVSHTASGSPNFIASSTIRNLDIFLAFFCKLLDNFIAVLDGIFDALNELSLFGVKLSGFQSSLERSENGKNALQLLQHAIDVITLMYAA